ncbi:hypothetical protein GDO81_022755 [Engystomops pustulosus]|uniref:Uncharacterized protein n=1 Tax=Engystomops pustulosus TaxID=76066 RepID=A0AAV6YTZ6_ENGPU|nr:hypothetical protein GDO81_022755 [Engystomops pustulosus]
MRLTRDPKWRLPHLLRSLLPGIHHFSVNPTIRGTGHPPCCQLPRLNISFLPPRTPPKSATTPCGMTSHTAVPPHPQRLLRSFLYTQ